MHITVLINIVVLDLFNQRRETGIIAVIGQKFWHTRTIYVTEYTDGIKTTALGVSEEQRKVLSRELKVL